MHVGAMAHGVGITESLAKRLAHRDRRDLGRVGRVHHHEAFGIDRLRPRAFAHAERVERGERVRSELDARADLADLRGLLENFYREAAAGEC